MAEVRFIDHRKRAREELDLVVERILTGWGITAERNAKLEIQNSPKRVDTGLLRNSIAYAVSGEAPSISSYQSNATDKNGKPIAVKTGNYSGTAPMGSRNKRAVYIGTNVEYAKYVHEGTQEMTPNRFIKNGIVNHKDDFVKIAKQELRR